MIITRLGIENFRNIALCELEPHSHFNVLAGHNGAGKSNVLEAIHVLANVKSFRTGNIRDFIRIGSDTGRVEATVMQGPLTRGVAVELADRRKRFTVNNKTIASFASYLGALRAVVFSPADLRLLQGSASERRRFLDRVVSGTSAAHLTDLQDYDAAVRSRNQLLKDSRVDPMLLDAYTDQMIPLAGRIIERRLTALAAMAPIISEVFNEVFSPDFSVDCVYQCRWLEDEPVQSVAILVEDQLRHSLTALANRERRSGHTLAGPHRDDLAITLNGLPTREYASQGQSRAIVLAMKITEIRYLQESNGDCPVLLLDDVSSELDRRRNEQLFAFIRGVQAQTFITTTDRQYIGITEDLREYRVEEGQITSV